MSITEKDITLCGHGSGTPSIKNMYLNKCLVVFLFQEMI